MEISYKELKELIKLDSSNELFNFENGELKPYNSKLDFQYHLSIFHDLVLEAASNTAKPTRNLMIDSYQRFTSNLNLYCNKTIQ